MLKEFTLKIKWFLYQKELKQRQRMFELATAENPFECLRKMGQKEAVERRKKLGLTEDLSVPFTQALEEKILERIRKEET